MMTLISIYYGRPARGQPARGQPTKSQPARDQAANLYRAYIQLLIIKILQHTSLISEAE